VKRVQQDQEGGRRSNVKKTPTLFINGVRYDGPLEYQAIATAVREAAQNVTE